MITVRGSAYPVAVRDYLLRRLALALFSALVVIYAAFMFVRLALPADAARQIAGVEAGADSDPLRRAERDLAEDSFVGHTRDFGSWLFGALRGDFGESYLSGRSVAADLVARIPVSVEFGLLSLLIGLAIGAPLGALSAVHRDQPLDVAGRAFATLGVAIPDFWIALLIVALAGRYQPLHPLVPGTFQRLTEDPWRNVADLALPSLILGAGIGGAMMRLMRLQMLSVLNADFVRTARAKGLPNRVVLYDHALRNAVLPLVTVIGLRIPVLVGGAVILESIFNIPGTGRFFLNAMEQRDFPIVQAVITLVTLTVVAGSLALDMLYAWLDPRIRFR